MIVKKTYEIFRAKYEKKPSIESKFPDYDWKTIYKSVNNKKFSSDIRSI